MDRRLEVIKLIREDIDIDINWLEGREFTGPTVAIMFGRLSAQIDALAKIVATTIPGWEELIDDDPEYLVQSGRDGK